MHDLVPNEYDTSTILLIIAVITVVEVCSLISLLIKYLYVDNSVINKSVGFDNVWEFTRTSSVFFTLNF